MQTNGLTFMKTNQSDLDNWDDLLITKLRIPAFPSDYHHRDRLINDLQTAMNQQVILLVAPTGYGKTALLVEWLSGKQPDKRHVVWVTLDTLDNTPIQFWSYILLGFQQEFPDFKFHRQQFLPYGLQPDHLYLLNPLLNEITRLSKPVYLVLDDYQAIQDETIHHSLEYLIDHQPLNLHIVIASRFAPPLRLSRKKALRHLVEFNSQDLSFTYPETTAYLSSVMGLRTNLDQFEQLHQATKGWIAGLQLAVLSLKNKVNTEAGWKDFPENVQEIEQYMFEEVLEQQDASTRNFLMQTSILSEFCPELCNAVTGQSNSLKMLQSIEQANLFITTIDKDQLWFRYHPLFATTLHANLKQKSPDEIPELHRRAYTWFREHGFADQAISHALAAGDVDIVADILEKSALNAIIKNDLITLVRWTQRFTPHLLNLHPHLGVYDALAHYFLGQYDQVEEKLELLRRLIDDNQMAYKSPEAVNRIRWEMSAIQGAIEMKNHPSDKATLCIQSLLRTAPKEDNYFTGFLGHTLAVAYVENDDLNAAIDAFHQGRDFALLHNLSNPIVQSQCEIAHMNKKRGRLAEAERAYQTALKYTDSDKAHFGSRILVLTGLMGIVFERNEIEKAKIFEKEIFSQFDRLEGAMGPLNYQITVLLQLAEYTLAQGNFRIAHYYFQRAEQEIQYTSAFLFHDLLDEYINVQVRMWISSDEKQKGEQWLKKRIELVKDYGKAAITESIGLARIYLAQDKVEPAITLLSPLASIAQQKDMQERRMEINLLQAIAFWRLGEKEMAYQKITQIVDFARAEKYCRIFINEGEEMKNLLQAYLENLRKLSPKAAKTAEIQYLIQLTNAFKNVRTPVAAPSEVKNMIAAESSLIEPLSQRESEVLTMLLGGKTAKEIAISLSITPNTVRAHIQSIHRKMNVHSRLEIYQRAKELNLIK